MKRAWTSPNEQILKRIRGLEWTGHNIPLTETESTLGGGVPLISDDGRTPVIKRTIRRFLGDRERIRVLDVGALEGGLSLEMAREGWEATGVEGRRANFEKAELIREYYALPNLRFALGDAKALDPGRDGLFDVVLCCGLLYHIDNPFALLQTLERMLSPDGLLFLDTHVAPDAGPARFETHMHDLSELTTFEHDAHTYEGCWFLEPKEGSLIERMWSAVSNDRSFWPTRRSLIRSTYHAGFHSIYELFGVFEIDREFGLRDTFSRLYLACMKSW